MEHGYFHQGDGLSLTGGELILAVSRIYSGSFGSCPDLARLNFLLFLIEGDGGVASNLMYRNTSYGPKSGYVENFIQENPELLRLKSYNRKNQNAKLDPDMRKKVQLTTEGEDIANRIIVNLTTRETRMIAQILSKWGRESHSEILTYLCLFYGDFCSGIDAAEPRRDEKA